MSAHRYEVGQYAVIVNEDEPEPVRFETSQGDVLLRADWNQVSDLQSALAKAEAGEAARKRAPGGVWEDQAQ